MLALKILIYASVNCGFSGVASLKLALVIQFSGEHKAKKECHKQFGQAVNIECLPVIQSEKIVARNMKEVRNANEHFNGRLNVFVFPVRYCLLGDI